MKIIETFPGASNFHLFEELPKLIYSSDSHRTKQHENLNKEYINACFVLTIDGIPKARVALYENPYLLYQGMKAGCVGNYECVEDLNVSSTLLKFVIERARERQNNFLIGPMNGSTWEFLSIQPPY